ncbi:MAG: two-component system, NtrC family, sensor kinase, partial [Thermoleophilaceae bacterium]|nr:two-component system, NtrC family, sensor kinase [Thermoleophilaceae bacterium]
MAVAIGFVAEHVAVVQRGELIAIDSRFAVRGREPPPRGIVIVGIDAPTFGDLRLRYPFPRSVHAGVIDRLTRDGARQIVYDISFQNPTTPREDAALLAAIRRARSIVLAVTQSTGFRRPVILGGARRIEGWGARLGVAQAAAPERGAYVRRMFYS